MRTGKLKKRPDPPVITSLMVHYIFQVWWNLNEWSYAFVDVRVSATLLVWAGK